MWACGHLTLPQSSGAPSHFANSTSTDAGMYGLRQHNAAERLNFEAAPSVGGQTQQWRNDRLPFPLPLTSGELARSDTLNYALSFIALSHTLEGNSQGRTCEVLSVSRNLSLAYLDMQLLTFHPHFPQPQPGKAPSHQEPVLSAYSTTAILPSA